RGEPGPGRRPQRSFPRLGRFRRRSYRDALKHSIGAVVYSGMEGTALIKPTREAILDATDRLLGRLGYQKTTIDDLAREADVGRRTIYLNFQSKEEIFLSSIDRV